jgi:hypothetical protein
MTSIFSGRLFKLVYIVILILILLLVGCADSQNGGESSNITEDSDSLNTKKVVLGPELIDIVGTYQLEAFTILDETNNVSVDESDLESWCGKMVITFDGMIMYDQVMGASSGTYQWQILALTKDALKLKEGDCETWVDYILMGDSFIIIWPDGPCMQGYTMTLRTIRTSYSDAYPTEGCPLPNEPVTLQIEDYVGTYLLDGFSYVYLEDGMMISQDDAASWSGEMMTTTDGVIDFILTMNLEDYHSVWRILAVDNETRQFLISDAASCEEWIDFTYDSEEDLLALMWSGDGCTGGVAMTFLFTKTDEAGITLNRFIKNNFVNFINDSNS